MMDSKSLLEVQSPRIQPTKCKMRVESKGLENSILGMPQSNSMRNNPCFMMYLNWAIAMDSKTNLELLNTHNMLKELKLQHQSLSLIQLKS